MDADEVADAFKHLHQSGKVLILVYRTLHLRNLRCCNHAFIYPCH